MISVHILEGHDKISPMDWVRPLHFDGEANTRSHYSGLPENNTMWIRVNECFGDWMFGKTVDEFHKHINKKMYHSINKGLQYEFVRGIMPDNHIWHFEGDGLCTILDKLQ